MLIRPRELDFLLYEWLAVDTFTQRGHFADHSRETFDAVLELSTKLAESQFLPHYKLADRNEPKIDGEGQVTVLPEVREAVHAYADAGLIAASFDADIGGAQLPAVIAAASFAIFAAANISTSGYILLTAANARLLAAFGSQELIDTFAKPQLDGRYLGTMCLSEPQAGSGLADITTRAAFETQDDLGARYRLTGTKMWISGGDHDISDNIVHLVLAKIAGEDGRIGSTSKDISIFAVPRNLPESLDPGQGRNDVVVAGLNHKMGYRGTSNCLLNFGEGVKYRPLGKAGAVGYLVGKPGQGLAIMFHMMNEARINVGVGASGLAYRGFMHALEYAKTRVQGRRPGGSSPAPIAEHPDVKRMLLAQKAYAEGSLALCLLCARLVDDSKTAPTAAEQTSAGQLLDLLTPVTKTWPSEWGLAANDIAIQIHGGYGYTRDFDVEQLYRDNRLNPIHEGTTGIQAIDLVGRKIWRDRGAAFGLLRERVLETEAKAQRIDRLKGHADSLQSVRARIEKTVGQLLEADYDAAVGNATAFLSAFGHFVVAWIWLEQAIVASTPSNADASFYAGKLLACDYYFDFEVPKISAWLETKSAVLSKVSADVL